MTLVCSELHRRGIRRALLQQAFRPSPGQSEPIRLRQPESRSVCQALGQAAFARRPSFVSCPFVPLFESAVICQFPSAVSEMNITAESTIDNRSGLTHTVARSSKFRAGARFTLKKNVVYFRESIGRCHLTCTPISKPITNQNSESIKSPATIGTSQGDGSATLSKRITATGVGAGVSDFFCFGWGGSELGTWCG